MRYGIISDIHSNLEAFQAVLQECRSQRVEALLCCGDIVGYGANPKECLQLVSKFKLPTVAGNHDWAVAGRIDYSYFTPDGQAGVAWSRSHVGIEGISYLSNLPLELIAEDYHLIHSSPLRPVEFTYLNNLPKISEAFDSIKAKVCFIGHSHVPMIVIKQGANVYQSIEDVEIKNECQYIVNVGSVGQPRDGNPLACFCIYDTNAQTIAIRRVIYDLATAQNKIRLANLPETLATRLSRGK